MSRDPDLYSLLKHCIPNDHSEQVTSHYYAEKIIRAREPGGRVMDVGCGDGRTIDLFRRLDSKAEWHGVDIESSPEVATRSRTDGTFHTYDGVNLPFDAASFDVVFSHQVFEHVLHPRPLLAEIARVMRPGAAFIGSLSYLEPYHSFSLWNFTPYGWHTLLHEAGLKVVELRPGIDSIALIQRQYQGRPKEAAGWFEKSPLNDEIEAWGRRTKRQPALINLRKIQYCGHLCFYAIRPAS